MVVKTALLRTGEASLKEIYSTVMHLAPKKVKNNNHFQAKIRQTLQMHFTNVKPGVWKSN